AVLPEAVRRVLVSQLSERLRTRVDVGDVDLAFWRGGVALEDVAIHSPIPGAAESPLVTWRRFAVAVRYLPLLSKTIELRRVALDAPHVALDRLANGEVNLQRLVSPAAESVEATKPEAAPERSRWKFAIRRLALRGGGIRFRDFAVEGGEPLEIAIPDVTVDDVALQPGVYGEPGRVGLYVRTEGGAVRVAATVWPLDVGFAAATRVKVFSLPLRRARVYVPGVGWSELRGTLDAVLDHGLAPGGRNALSGLVRLRDVAIRVPDLAEAAFGLERLAVRLDPLDLAARRVRLPRIEIAGAAVAVDLAGGGGPLPLFARRASPAAAPPAAGGGASATPWHWTVDRLDLERSRVVLLEATAPVEVGLDVHATRLSDAGDPGHVAATVAVPPGRVTVDGALRATPPAFGGTVRVEALPVHDLFRVARAAARLPPGLLRAAVLGADLALEAGVRSDGGPAAVADAVSVKGAVEVAGLDVAGPDPERFAVAWRRLVVPIDGAELPGLVPGAAGAPVRAPRVALGAVRLDEPAIRVTRTATGLALPARETPAGDTAPAAPAAEAPEAPAASASPPADVVIGSFVLARGRIGFVDETVTPAFTGRIQPLDVDARGIRSAGPVVDAFTLTADTPQKGRIDLRGSIRPEGGKVRVNGKDVALAPYNPYVASFSPYSIGRGSSVSVRTDVAFGKGAYDSKTALTLQRLSVKGAAGDSLFKEQFGIPLSLALALLRDPQGNIKLDIPVAVDASGTRIGLGTVVAGAVRSALLGALTSPLKGLGMVFGGGDRLEALEPPPVGVAVGRAVLTGDGERQAATLASFLASHPAVGVELSGVVVPADVRWLAEQDVRADLEAQKGVVSAIRGLPALLARRRIVRALGERATGGTGELRAGDQALLDDWVAARPAPGADRLRALAAERAAALAAVLRDRHGVPPARVTVADVPGEPRDGVPSVAVALGASED
ncbi:MAG TPA: DUF748 domain-containing protein, partial [Candidatus Binatia bacterium]|nr:DUF748 domain-containing protein [Candidatus Binatia bacterium]